MVKQPVEPYIYSLRDDITQWVKAKYFVDEILIYKSLL
jgi:hypothetical protein